MDINKLPIEKYEDQYRWLSNFYAVDIEFEGATYPSVEHAYQAAKTTNLEERKKFQKGTRVIKGKDDNGDLVIGELLAAEAKKAGRNLQVRSGWDAMKVELMKQLKIQKYCKPYFKKLLLETGEREIIHGVWWNDTFWGVRYGNGKNIDGRLTMDIRAMLRLQEPSPKPVISGRQNG